MTQIKKGLEVEFLEMSGSSLPAGALQPGLDWCVGRWVNQAGAANLSAEQATGRRIQHGQFCLFFSVEHGDSSSGTVHQKRKPGHFQTQAQPKTPSIYSIGEAYQAIFVPQKAIWSIV